MITQQDIAALADMLARLPMTRAEALYTEALLRRLAMMVPAPAEPKPPEPGTNSE